MFSKMRRQLTVICAVATGAVLLFMASLSLHFSLNRLHLQYEETFRSNINTVRFYLQSQSVIDQTWLNQTESDNDLWIRVEGRQSQLQYTRQNETRDVLTTEAMAYARIQHGLEPFSASPESEPLIFDFNWESRSYFGSVTSLSFGSDQIFVTMLKDRSAEAAAAAQLAAAFTVCVTLSMVFLIFFAWYFSGRAVRPVEESHRKQTEFLSAAAHELKSPLAVIHLSAQTMKKSPVLAGALADQIECEAQRLARLVSNLLFLARSDQKAWTSRLSEASPKTILLNSVERYEQTAHEKGISLEICLDEALPLISCDQQLIEQVLSIFLDNALRFTPKEGTIQLSCYPLTKQRVVFTVADSGCGISDEEKKKVFDRFYQVDPSRTSKEHYGLGLSIAREIATLHKGSVGVTDSELGGAAFTLTL